jgi:hypothetical protein
VFSADAFLNRSDYVIAFEALRGIMPGWLVSVLQSLPNKQMSRLKDYMKIARRVARSLVDRQMEIHAAGKESGKDVLSILGEYFLTSTSLRASNPMLDQ